MVVFSFANRSKNNPARFMLFFFSSVRARAYFLKSDADENEGAEKTLDFE
jgi:hypothetical protein